MAVSPSLALRHWERDGIGQAKWHSARSGRWLGWAGLGRLVQVGRERRHGVLSRSDLRLSVLLCVFVLLARTSWEDRGVV